MTDHARLERILTETLQLPRRPVAVAFRDTAPAGVTKFNGVQPSGCSFWTLAAGGQAFYTVPADHYNCPIGSYTHAVPLPPERESELPETLALMTGLGYVRPEEVAGIPRLPEPPGVIVYAPLAESPLEPDVVIVAGRPGRLMLLHEAALAAGVTLQPLLGRPTCMAIPAAQPGGIVASLGCIGNRIYTDLPEEELYVMLSGRDLGGIAEALKRIVRANAALTDHHQARRAELRTG